MPALPRLAAPDRTLVVTADEHLLDGVLRVLAAAGVDAQLATGGPLLRRAHRDAPLVLIGADVLDAPAVRALPRRPGLVVVSVDELEPPAWATAVELGAERVIRLPADEAWLLARAGTAGRSTVDRGWLIAVGGCCGGTGASTLAAAVALAGAARGPGVLLVDTDPWAGGLDLLLGVEHAEGLRWTDLTELRGSVSGTALLAALPGTAGVRVLSAGRGDPVEPSEEAVLAAVGAAQAEGWPVVVDLPRPCAAGAGGAAEAVLAEADLTCLVVPARLRAVSAARLLAGDDGTWTSAALVVRPVPGGLSAREVADGVGRPVLAVLGHDRSAAPRAERGEPPAVGGRAPFGVVARRLLAEVSQRIRRPR